MMILYSTELRRQFKSIVYALKEIIQLVLFFILITIIWGFLGTRLIGNLDNSVEYDDYASNFNDLFPASTLLYGMISFDTYPDSMLPAISYSQYYLIYFLLYCSLLVLVFVPIPVAVVFEAFRVKTKPYTY